MPNLRKLAKGQPCMIRLPGCLGGGETTVGCHYRMAGDGLGRKPPDTRLAWGCSNCHDIVDFRVKLPDWTREEIKLAHLEGVIRTQEAAGVSFYIVDDWNDVPDRVWTEL